MDELATIERLDRFIRLAKDLGFDIRHELLDGCGAGVCTVHGRPCLFLDLSCGPAEQLEAIKKALPESSN